MRRIPLDCRRFLVIPSWQIGKRKFWRQCCHTRKLVVVVFVLAECLFSAKLAGACSKQNLQSVCSAQKPAERSFSAKPAERSFSAKPAERLFNTKPAECLFSAKPAERLLNTKLAECCPARSLQVCGVFVPCESLRGVCSAPPTGARARVPAGARARGRAFQVWHVGGVGCCTRGCAHRVRPCPGGLGYPFKAHRGFAQVSQVLSHSPVFLHDNPSAVRPRTYNHDSPCFL